MGEGQVHTVQSLLFLIQIQIFKKPLWLTVNLWLISRVLKNLFLMIFGNVFHACIMEQLCGGPFYTIPTNVHSPIAL